MTSTNPAQSTPNPTRTSALVTGATRGLGRETVRRLSALGWTVWLGARDLGTGEVVAKDLATAGSDIRPVQLDVTDDASVAAAAARIAADQDHLDVLINNAGITGPFVGALETKPADFIGCYGVNVLGPVRTLQAFLPLLEKAVQPRVVMVSSGVGSFGITTDPDRFEYNLGGLVYQSSKSALNMITSQYAKALPGFQINAIDPGYTATDLNHHQGPQTVTEGTEAIFTAATAAPDGPTGQYFDAAGPVPW